MKFPSDISFAAFLQYSPRGQKKESLLSQAVTRAIKSDGILPQSSLRAINYAARRLAQELPKYPFLQARFGPGVVLVRAPRSAPLVPGALWPTQRLCQAMQTEGLAADVLPLLTRIKAVPKSATAAPGQRPDAETHFDSLQVGSTQPPFFLAPEHHNRRRLDDAWSYASRLLPPPRGRPPADRD